MVGCKDGFDLVDTQLCKDKTVMVNDGHDLPWQGIWGVKKGYSEIDLPKQLYGPISSYYSIYDGQQKYKDIDILDPTKNNPTLLFGNSLVKRLSLTGPSIFRVKTFRIF